MIHPAYQIKIPTNQEKVAPVHNKLCFGARGRIGANMHAIKYPALVRVDLLILPIFSLVRPSRTVSCLVTSLSHVSDSPQHHSSAPYHLSGSMKNALHDLPDFSFFPRNAHLRRGGLCFEFWGCLELNTDLPSNYIHVSSRIVGGAPACGREVEFGARVCGLSHKLHVSACRVGIYGHSIIK
jgi:hypothetical protein